MIYEEFLERLANVKKELVKMKKVKSFQLKYV